MKLHHLHILSVMFLWAFIPHLAHAGTNTYLCKILQAVELSDDGRLVEHDGVWKTLIGQSFTVDRRTGEMIGPPFDTDGWLGGVKVLNPGSNENSYQAIVVSGQPNVTAKYIYVSEHYEGQYKPFWGNGSYRVIFSGTCS